MDNRGYIRLSRKFFKNKYWLRERTYSQAEAWLDLIQMARFEAEPQNKVLPGGRQIVIERGEIHSSLRFLSARWGWGIMQVRTFLKSCVASQQITQRMAQGEGIITLCNYNEYNPLSNNTPDNTPDNTPEMPVTSCKHGDCDTLFSESNTPDNTPDNTPVTHRYHTDNTNKKKENKEKNVNKEKKEIDMSGNAARPLFPFDECLNFVSQFNKIRGTHYQATKKVRTQFNARLKEGFTPAQMIEALKNAMNDDFHVREGFKYLTPEFFTRSDKIEMYLNRMPVKASANAKSDDWEAKVMEKLNVKIKKQEQ